MPPGGGLFSRLKDKTASLSGRSNTVSENTPSQSLRSSAEQAPPRLVLTNEDDTDSELATSYEGSNAPSVPPPAMIKGNGKSNGVRTTSDRERPPQLVLQRYGDATLLDIDVKTPTKGREAGSASDTAGRPATGASVFTDPFATSSDMRRKPTKGDLEASKSPSRKASFVSLRRIRSSPNSLKDKGSPTSRRASLASSEGVSPNDRQILEQISDGSPPLPSSLVASPTTLSLSSSAYLAAPSNDSDTVSLNSTASASGKKKGLRSWTGSRKPSGPTGGIAGALASSGMSLATHATGGQNSPPGLRPLPGSKHTKRSTRAGTGLKHAIRMSMDNTLVHGGPGFNASPPRSSEERDAELSDELYESPDAFSFDDDDIPVTGFAVASSKRNVDFHTLFPDVPGNDYLIEDYGCALQRDILVQGRLYISENHMCFHANIFGWVTNVTFPFSDVTSLEKKMTAFVIPNAIQVTTRNVKYTFASFITRDTSYDVIQNIWRLSSPNGELPLQNGEEGSLRSGSVGNGSFIASEEASIVPDPSDTGEKRKRRAMACACLKQGEHFSEIIMNCVIPGTPEQIQNLMWTSGFVRDFMLNNQKLIDIQSSEWSPQSTGSHLLSRTMTYTKPLNNNLGPKSTKCEITDETLHADPNDYYSTLTITRTPGVPSGNAFSVKTRTCLMWAGPSSTQVLVTSMVEWTGRSFIKSMIEKGAMDGQRSYHVALETAMRTYIHEHKTEFFPVGELELQVAAEEISAIMNPILVPEAPLSPEEARKVWQRETEAKGLQWALDTFTGTWNVATKSASGAVELLCDIFENTSRPTFVTAIIVALVISNIWTLTRFQNTKYEQVALKRRHHTSPYDAAPLADEDLKAEALRVLLENVISRTSPTPANLPSSSSSSSLPAIPVPESSLRTDIRSLQEALADIEQRMKELKFKLSKLDEEVINS